MQDIEVKKTEKEEEKETPLEEGVSSNVSQVSEDEIGKMFKSGVHYGYSKRTRHPKIKPYLYGSKNEIQIFDLEKVKASLEKAQEFIKNLGQEKKTVFFVGTKPAAKNLIEQAAKSIQMPFCIERWLGGTFTNFGVIRKRIDYFQDLKKKKETDEWNKYTKKERLEFDKKIDKMERFFSGFEQMQKTPDAIVIIDPKDEKIALKESTQIGIPTIALLGSDNNPLDVSYPVVANDASRASIKYFLDRVIVAYNEGLKLGLEAKVEVKVEVKVEDKKE